MCDRVAVSFTTRPELSGTFGMVASTHWLASASGMAVLERAATPSTPRWPPASCSRSSSRTSTGRAATCPRSSGAPSAASRSCCARRARRPPAPRSSTTARSASSACPAPACSPPACRAPSTAGCSCCATSGRSGSRRSWRPPSHYAAGGFPVLPKIHGAIAGSAELFRTEWPSSAALWLPDGRPPAAGGYAANTALAAHVRPARGRRRGARAATATSRSRPPGGSGARASWPTRSSAFLDAAEVADASGARHRGVLAGGDLAGWRATWEAPLQADFGGFTVCKTGPWGQGPVFLQLLRLLEGFDLEALGRDSAAFAHTVVECMKLALADREAWYGDVEVPVADLLSAAYAAERRALVGEEASRDLRPGAPGGRAPRLPRLVAEAARRALGRRRGRRADARRHVPRRRRRPLGQPRVGHAERRLAAELARDPRPRLLPGHARADVLARGRAAGLARARARPRTTLSPSLALRDGERRARLRDAGRRPAGPVVAAVLAARTPCSAWTCRRRSTRPRSTPPTSPSSFYPRAAQPGHARDRGARPARRRSRSCATAATTSRSPARGRSAGSARSRAIATGLLRAAANPRGMQGYAVGR